MAKTKPVDVRKVKVTCPELDDITNGMAKITSCRLECQVNSPSRAILGVTLSVPKDISRVGILSESQADVIGGGQTLEDLLQLSGAYQAKLFSTTGSEVTLKIENQKIDSSIINTTVISGVLSSPTFRVVAGKLSTTFSILSKDSLMEAFNPSIYANTQNTHGGSSLAVSDLSRVFRDTFTSNTGVNKVSTHIMDLLDVTVDDSKGIFERSLLAPAGSTKEEQSNNKVIFKNAQETNKDANILDVIKGLLGRSEGFTGLLPGPGDWEGSPLVDDINLFEHPDGVLTRIDLDTYAKWLLREFLSSKNFYNFLLQSVCPSFLFDYVCPFYDENSPTSRLQYTKVNTQPDGVKVHFLDEVKSVSLNLASSYQRPISQIITHGTVTMPHGAAAGTQTPLGAHPPAPDPKFGKIVNMSAPGWWSSYHRNEQQLAETPKTSDGIQGNGRQIKANAQNKTNDIKNIHKEPKELSFLQNWATLQYGNLALQHTHAALVLPLDLRWGKDPDFQIGERILIIAGKSTTGIEATKKPYFEGFLQAVSHDIAVESSGTGVSQTHLEFSHIKTYGASDGPIGWSIFSLPGDKPLG